jgi:lipopolysaccharide export system permease protein
MSFTFFPAKTIAWYMARLFLVRTFAVLFALVLVLQALDLLSESGKILGVPGNGQAELMTYVSLRTPQIIARFLPFSVLLSTIITLVTLNQHSEVVSMKAAGLSAHQVLAPLIFASLFVAAIAFAFNDRIVSRATSTLNRWQKIEYAHLPPDRKALDDVWVRDGENLINAGTVIGRGPDARLENVKIYGRQNGRLLWVASAKTGRQQGGGWLLSGVKRFDIATGRSTNFPDQQIGKGMAPDRFTLANVQADGMSFGGLWHAIEELNAAGRPTTALSASLWHKISGPLSTLLMPLLGAVAAFGIARSGKLFIRAIIGMALGFAYFVADNFGLAMGNLGAYPPVLAAWGPFFLFLLIGEFVLFRTEE